LAQFFCAGYIESIANRPAQQAGATRLAVELATQMAPNPGRRAAAVFRARKQCRVRLTGYGLKWIFRR
jgi:hypothetical protein